MTSEEPEILEPDPKLSIASYPKPALPLLYPQIEWDDAQVCNCFLRPEPASSNSRQLLQAGQDVTRGAPNFVHLIPHLTQSLALRGER